MGGTAYRIGRYVLSHGDWFWDDIPEDGIENPAFYTTYMVACEIWKQWTSHKIDKELSLETLFGVKQGEDGNYYLGDKSPRTWFFNTLKSQNKTIDYWPELSLNFKDRSDKNGNYLPPPYYFLQSPIGDNNIVIMPKPKRFTIKELWELDWLWEKGFCNCPLPFVEALLFEKAMLLFNI
jgi:hypothetical protein